MEHGTIIRSDDLLGYFAWPSIVRTAEGSLAVVCSGYRLRHVDPFGKIILLYSKDEGNSWSTPQIALDTPLDDRDAGLVRYKGELYVTSFNNTRLAQRNFESLYYADRKSQNALCDAYLDLISDEEEQKYIGASISRISEDPKRRTFVKVPLSSPHGPIELTDGRMFYVGKLFAKDNNDPFTNIHYITSTDGEHFTEPVALPMDPDHIKKGCYFCEPYAIQTKSGRILLHIRTHLNRDFSIYQCYSDDNGESFTLPKPFGYHGSPPHLFQHSSGAIVLTYSYRKAPFGQRARISRDDGESWSEEIILRGDGSDGDLGYPATEELKDGRLITVYYHQCAGDRNPNIQYTVWGVEEL